MAHFCIPKLGGLSRGGRIRDIDQSDAGLRFMALDKAVKMCEGQQKQKSVNFERTILPKLD